MKIYEIEIDDTIYQVKVRNISEDEYSSKTSSTVMDSSSETDVVISAPMSGTILNVLVKEGQFVKQGDNLVILEAMKMENEIVASKDGQIKKILVKNQDLVDSEQTLIIM
ncbi:biotin/lipoyl-binding protein [Enterococcus sp. 669A]|uniref:Biotin/lipoyl-binding protein n=1 Tax=Candidatus Enterococcus moelleringii TaxID=2815325 RepID=A0ABS3L7Y4_9ENTE|nr:biotin/lipoyl-containing protein [Enterococcus sp. 669A]MBO1305720.1 biotin/lipoyl-binding protein [Enterococcus sp. 669A]